MQYLRLDAVLALHRRFGGDAGLRDENVLRGALARPQSGFGETELFPTVWLKAAALLHGLTTTQAFHDGNKRTAWMSTVLFLRGNGEGISQVDALTAESFVRTVAATPVDGQPWLSIEDIARWLEDRCRPARFFHRAAIQLPSLLDGDGRVLPVVATECVLLGPAVVRIGADSAMIDCSLGPMPDQCLAEITRREQDIPNGVLLFPSSLFKGCTFLWTSFLVYPEEAARVLAGSWHNTPNPQPD